MEEQEMEVGAIDQNLANNLAKMEDYEPGSTERNALLSENSFYEQARIDEMRLETSFRSQSLAEEQLKFDKEKHVAETKVKIIDIAVKAVLGISGLICGCIVAFGEMDLEENGSNRSKAAQKFGSIFKNWK